ncbi:MAG: PrgI family protein [Patescibacteria group bacterium]
MPDKFIVPQFIENEDKILGPVTVRQFILSLVSVFIAFIEYKILKLPYFIMSAVITVGIGATFGFVKVNGQPFHIFFLNFAQTMLRPNMRVWDKHPTDDELRLLIKPQTIAEPEDTSKTHKPRPGSSRLRDLSLTVNTGGVYDAEHENE